VGVSWHALTTVEAWLRGAWIGEGTQCAFTSARLSVKEETLGAELFSTFAIIETNNKSASTFGGNDSFGSLALTKNVSRRWNNW
jgi:hypothetical protein